MKNEVKTVTNQDEMKWRVAGRPFYGKNDAASTDQV